MLDFLIDIDTKIFLFFNGMHAPFWDSFMGYFTGKAIWVPMYVSSAYIIFRNCHWKAAVCISIGIVLTIVLSDQICATIIRPVVERVRPARLENPISAFVHIVDGYRGGAYGFPSCHAANSFALAVFLSFLFCKRWFALFVLLWAAMNSYSRLYLGVHYPGDLIVGAIVGSCFGWAGYTTSRLIVSQIKISGKPVSVTSFHHTGIMIAIGCATAVYILIRSLADIF